VDMEVLLKAEESSLLLMEERKALVKQDANPEDLESAALADRFLKLEARVTKAQDSKLRQPSTGVQQARAPS